MAASDASRFESLRRRVAVEHHVSLSPDDPILILYTANETMIREAAEALDAAVKRSVADQKSELEQLAQRWSVTALQVGERLLAQAIRQNSDLLERARISAAESARAELERAGVEIIRRHQLAAGIGLCASLVTLAVAVGLWFQLGAPGGQPSGAAQCRVGDAKTCPMSDDREAARSRCSVLGHSGDKMHPL